MSGCGEVRERLGEFLTGALEGAGAEEVSRHLAKCDACSEELCALQGLEGTLWGVEPVRARRPGRRLLAAGAAAAALLAVLLVWASVHRPERIVLVAGRLDGAGQVFRPGDRLPGGPLAVAEPAVIDLPHAQVRGAAGARIALEGPRRVRLLGGASSFDVEAGEGDFAVLTPLGEVTVLGTAFRVEVGEEAAMQRGMVLRSGAAAVVVVTVTAGVVLWEGTDDGLSAARVEAGRTLIARPGSRELVPSGPEAVEELRRRNEKLEEERRELARDREELRGKVEALEREALDRKAKDGEPGPGAEGRPGAIAIPFGPWEGLPEITEGEWRTAVEACGKMEDLHREQKELGKSLEELPPETILRYSMENHRLAALAMKVAGKLPTHATGNGEFTHPIVQWNLLARRLEEAGLPFSPVQLRRLSRLGEEFLGRWESLQRSYGERTLLVEMLIDELEVKRTFDARMEEVLSPRQREAVLDPGLRHLNGLDLHSPLILAGILAKPLARGSREELRDGAAGLWADSWGLERAGIEAHADLLDRWMAEVEPRLAPVKDPSSTLFHLDDAIAAGRAQARLMRALLDRGGLEEAARARVSESPVFVVPRLVEKP